MFSGLTHWAEELVVEHGLWFLFVFSLTESFVQPIPVEPVLLAAVGFDIASPLTLLIIASVSSILGGSLGFWVGERYGHNAFLLVFKKHGNKWMDQGERFFEKWGMWAVFLGAFSPIPFKVMAWLSGIFEMKYWQFLVAATLGRIPRFAVVIYGLDFFLGS